MKNKIYNNREIYNKARKVVETTHKAQHKEMLERYLYLVNKRINKNNECNLEMYSLRNKFYNNYGSYILLLQKRRNYDNR